MTSNSEIYLFFDGSTPQKEDDGQVTAQVLTQASDVSSKNLKTGDELFPIVLLGSLLFVSLFFLLCRMLAIKICERFRVKKFSRLQNNLE